MRKIKNLKHLKDEKKRLQQRQEELEKKLRGDLGELKKTLQPGSLAKNAFKWWLGKKTVDIINKKSILHSTLSYGAALAAKRFAEKTEEKLNNVFKGK